MRLTGSDFGADDPEQVEEHLDVAISSLPVPLVSATLRWTTRCHDSLHAYRSSLSKLLVLKVHLDISAGHK